MSALDKNAHYATITKIRTQYGKRLSRADYEELLSKKSVVEATEYLKGSTMYSKALANIDASTVHRGYLEMILRRNLFDRIWNSANSSSWTGSHFTGSAL